MRLIMLGTGNAEAVACYNSCHIVDNGGEYFLVDAGGGNGIFRQLHAAGIPWQDVRHIFITHRHIDHSLGVLWLIRHILAAAKDGTYSGSATIYGHPEVVAVLRSAVREFLSKKHEKRMEGRIQLRELEDGETVHIAGSDVTFFDVHAPKVRQFGYSLALPDGGRLVSCGDEPARPEVDQYTRGAAFLMHEAYCLASEAELAARAAKNHSTVEKAARKAQELGAGSLILHHTQDNCLDERKQKYTDAARQHFAGRIYVPDDLEQIELCSAGTTGAAAWKE